MRGKQGAKAERRRVESAGETIAQLSAALSEAKKRARDAERAAAAIPGMRARIAALEADPVVEEVAEWAAEIRRNRALQRSRWDAAKPDWWRLLNDLCDHAFSLETQCDRVEFVFRRYPLLMKFLGHCDTMEYEHRAIKAHTLSPDAARRLERARGLRGELEGNPEVDMADLAASLWNAPQLALDSDMSEYLGIKKAEAS